jgi:tRNA(fMet)-specific endonuclease VapC
MVKGYLIDTDTLSYAIKGNRQVITKLDEAFIEHGYVNFSILTYYEALNGLLYKDARKQLGKLQKLIEVNRVLPLSIREASKAAEIFAELRREGIAIGHNDIMIAATAIENDLKLITNNDRHFKHVPGLEYETWV